MYSHERKTKITELLKVQSAVSVNILAEMLHTSKETIRRDLRELQGLNMLKRTHGGAVLAESNTSISKHGNTFSNADRPFVARHISNIEEKKLIAQKAASFINDRDTIFIDNSSTTLFLSQYLLPSISITIITNSIKVLSETAKLENPNITLIALGGFYNASNFSVYGSRTIKSAEEFFPNKTFISCTGISANSKITDISLYEVDTKKALMDKSDSVYLLADHTKFKTNGPFLLSNFDDIDYIVTDRYEHDPLAAMQIQTITSTHNVKIITN